MIGNRFLICHNQAKERLEVIDTWNSDEVKVSMNMEYTMPSHHREYILEIVIRQCFDLNLEHDERYHYLCEVENWSGRRVIKTKNLYHPQFNVHNLL
jgi:hypothetical protein